MSNLWWLTPEGKQQLDAENRALDERASYEHAIQQRDEQNERLFEEELARARLVARNSLRG